ncbi:MAG: ABC transporter permease [Lysinibacillus sp.]
MLKLIQNEWMKLWRKKGTWAMLIILILVIIGPGILVKYYESQNTDERTWQEIEQENIAMNKETLASEDINDGDTAFFEEQIAISEYRLANNLPTQIGESLEGFISNGISLFILVTLFTVITAASIVSSEFSTGTIKMLLTRPVSRLKILTSKLLTVFLFGLLLIVVNLCMSAITGAVLFGPASGVELELVKGEFVEKAIGSDLAYTALLSCGDFIMSTLFAFLVGSVFRSSSLAIGLTMFLSFTGSMIVMFLSKYDFVKYIWITHSDLTQHQNKNFIVEGITMPLSLTVLSVYAILFLVISYTTFIKRDVTA